MRRVVITGLGMVTPLACGVEETWSRLVAGKSGAGTITKFDASNVITQYACEIPRGDGTDGTFNPDDWMEPKDRRKVDDFILYAMAAASQAVEDSGWRPTGPNFSWSTAGQAGSPAPMAEPCACIGEPPASRSLMCAVMSSRNILPLAPVGFTLPRSTPSSRANARTDGVAWAPVGISIAASTATDAANNSAATTTTVSTQADLSVAITASAAQVLVNVPVTFTATATNLGPSDAQNVAVSVTLSPDFRYTGHTATGATCTVPQVGNSGVITCTWAGATAPAAQRVMSVVAFSNNTNLNSVRATVASATTDPVAPNNSASVTVQVGELIEEIPTMGRTALMLLGLMLALGGIVAIRRHS